jgi:hypothetical protein
MKVFKQDQLVGEVDDKTLKLKAGIPEFQREFKRISTKGARRMAPGPEMEETLTDSRVEVPVDSLNRMIKGLEAEGYDIQQ